MDFNVNDWLGDWISFEHLIDNHDPNLDRAWKDSTKAMRSKPLFAHHDARRCATLLGKSLQNLGQGVAIPHWWMAYRAAVRSWRR